MTKVERRETSQAKSSKQVNHITTSENIRSSNIIIGANHYRRQCLLALTLLLISANSLAMTTSLTQASELQPAVKLDTSSIIDNKPAAEQANSHPAVSSVDSAAAAVVAASTNQATAEEKQQPIVPTVAVAAAELEKRADVEQKIDSKAVESADNKPPNVSAVESTAAAAAAAGAEQEQQQQQQAQTARKSRADSTVSSELSKVSDSSSKSSGGEKSPSSTAAAASKASESGATTKAPAASKSSGSKSSGQQQVKSSSGNSKSKLPANLGTVTSTGSGGHYMSKHDAYSAIAEKHGALAHDAMRKSDKRQLGHGHNSGGGFGGIKKASGGLVGDVFGPFKGVTDSGLARSE